MSRLARAALPAYLTSACLTLSCVTTLDSASTFPETLEMYRLQSGTRALAVAVDESGRRAWGVYEAPLQGTANKRALEVCRGNAARVGIRAPCFLFAESDAQSEETLIGCGEGRIPRSRCALQSRYGW